MAISLGTLEQTIVERGGDELLRKLGLIDAAATRLGAKPITIGLSAPGTAAVTQGLSNVTRSANIGFQAMTVLMQSQTSLAQSSSGLAATTEKTATATTDQRRAAEQAATAIDKQTAATKRLSDAEQTEINAARRSRENRGARAPGQLTDVAIAGGAARFDAMFPNAAAAKAAADANDKLTASHAKAAVAANQQGASLERTTRQTTGFNRELVKADGQLTAFSRRGVTALNGIAFGFSQMAATGEASLRSIAGSVTGVLSFMGTKGAIGAIGATIGLAVFDVFKANQKRALELRAMESQAAAKDELTQRKAQLDLLDATEKAAYDRANQSLKEFYDDRAGIIAQRAAAEVRARELQAAALERKASDLEAFTQVAGRDVLPDALRSANIMQVAELRSQAQSLRVEAQAAATQGQAEQIRNTAERAAAEKALAAQVLGFENRTREARGETHDARMAQIDEEVASFARLSLREGETAEKRAAAVDAMRKALTMQALFEDGENRISIIQNDLANKRTEIQALVSQGQISQLEGERRIAAEERRRIPDLEAIAKAMLAIGMALNNPAMISGAQQLFATIAGLGDVVEPLERRLLSALDSLEQKLPNVAAAFRAEMQKITDAGGEIPLTLVIRAESIVTAASQVQAEVEGAGLNIANVLTSSLAAGFSSSFTKGSGKSFFEALGISMLSGVGTVIANLGAAMLTYGLIMAAFAPAALLTPFAGYALSAPASIAAGTALLALGTGLGAIAANNTGSRTGGGGGGATSFSQANRDTVQHIWLDPDRNLPGRAADTATAITRSASAPATPMQPVNVYQTIIGAGDPVAQREVAALARNAVRAGYSLGNG